MIDPIVIAAIRKVTPALIANEMLSVQSMVGVTAMINIHMKTSRDKTCGYTMEKNLQKK